MSITLVDSPNQLHSLRKEFASQKIIALDTEFHSENRYFSELMLLQFADQNGNVWIVDPKKVHPAPLGAALRHTTIITHGGKEDINLLYRELGLRPKQFFDTQIAAALLGHRFPMGLADLAPLMINQEVSKAETLTDWSKRPLHPKQIEYAAKDALILLPLYEALLQQLKDANKEHLCWEAGKELVDHTLEYKSAGLEWLRWNVSETLKPETRRILTRILEWREDIAERKNKQPNYILPRSSALALARQAPTHIRQIQNRKINRIFLSKYGKDVVALIKEALQDDEIYELPPSESKLPASAIYLWGKLFSQQVAIHHELLMPKSLSKKIAVEGTSFIRGWRKEVCLTDLTHFLEGKQKICFKDGLLVLEPTTP